MKIFQPKFWLLPAFLAWAAYATAATYYFSASTGDDSRSFAEAQNSATPWRSVDKFNAVFSQLQPGDAVLFKKGEAFYGGMYLDRSGSAGSPIVIGSYGTGARPVISGFTQIGEWTAIGNGIYESPALNTSVEINMLVINDTNYALGRFPNADAANGGYLTINSVSANTLNSQNLPGSPDFDGGQLVLRSSHWTFERFPVSNHSGSSISFSGATQYDAKEGYGFFIQRHISTLDQYGEWYFNPATKKIAVYFGTQAPNAATVVKASTVEVLADIRGSNLRFEGLSLTGANRYALGNNGHNVDQIVISDCAINFSGMDALFFQGADDITLENSIIENSNNCAAKLFYCPTATLRNNRIENTGMQAGMGGDADGNYTAVLSEAAGFVAEYNHIINTGYIAVRFGNGDNLIKNNYIDTFCAVLDDGAGIYAYDSGGNIANRKITGNIILNGIGANPGTRATTETAVEGIYLDDNTRDIEVSNNTVARCGSQGIFVHNAQNFILKENTFFNNNVQSLIKSDAFGNAISGASVTDNIYFSKEVGETVFHIYSDANDIGSMGVFDYNYYVRPFYDWLPLQVQYQNSSGVYLNQPYELADWQSTFGHGTNSKKSPVQLAAYTINSLVGGNRLTNEGFNNDIGGLWCFSAYSDCDIDWVANSPLDGGALQVAGPSPSRIGMNCGVLAKEKHYIVRFSASAGKATSMEVYYMQSQSPWATISALVPVQLGTARQDYEILISFPENEAEGTIQFQFGGENTTYWLDNLQMYEANLTAADPDDYIRFEYNITTSNKTVNLNGSYVDAKNNAYSGTITLAPYQSRVLIRTGDAPPDPDKDNDGVPDAEDQCPGFDDSLDEDNDDVPDDCDSCSGSDDNLDSDLDGVPDGCDSCAGYDDHIDTDGDGIPDGCDDCTEITESICPSGDCDVNGNPIAPDTYAATQRINSSGQVSTGGSVIFKAGEQVVLKPGFSVAAGGSFQAMIIQCDETAATAGKEQQPATIVGPASSNPQAEKNTGDIPEIGIENRWAESLPEAALQPWKIYPNPLGSGQSELNIQLYTQEKELRLSIVDQFGRTVRVLQPHTEPGWNHLRWQMDNLPAGAYYLYYANAPALMQRAYPFMVIGN